jgi:hypothetical protein
VNQWLAGNRYRRYPFEQDTTLPFPDTVVVSAQVVLATAFAVTDVTLTSVVAGTNALTLIFAIGSTPLPGYTLEGTISTLAAEEVRIPLVLKLSGTPYPALGYGFLMIGQPTDAAVSSMSGLTAKLDRSVIRLNVASQTLNVRVANTLRAGASTVAYVGGTPQVLSVQGMTSSTVAACIERATAPTAQQEEMEPTVRGAATTLVDIPSPGGTRTVLSAGAVTTITTTPATQTTTVPAVPTDRDADVDVGIVPTTRVLSAGYNVKLSGNVPLNTVQLNYQLAAGLGMDCSGILGYSPATLSRVCVKSINGVYPVAQDLTLTPDTGIAILPDQLNHRLLILVNPLNLTRVHP